MNVTEKYLLDRAQISDVATAFAIALDTRDWDLFRSLIADEVEIDYPQSVGVATFTADELVATATGFFSRLDATQHISANHLIAIDGDTATCTSTLHPQHYLASQVENPVQRQIGYYVNRLEHHDTWRITHSQQRVSWQDGNQDVFLAAAGVFG
jgi:hypothetical protein